MPFEIVRNDIANMQVDAIVSAASHRPQVTSATAQAIHRKAGPELLKARESLGYIVTGEAAITPAFNLDTRFVIHAPSPRWLDGAHGEQDLLRKTYLRCLNLALEKGCESIAIPLLATGNNGFPQQIALQIAVDTFTSFLFEHDMHIYLVVFNKESVVLSEKLVQSVASYIDQNYVDELELEFRSRNIRRRQESTLLREMCLSSEAVCATSPKLKSEACEKSSAPTDLTTFLKQKDASFAVTLVDLIERSGQKNSEVYKKANVDKKLFSKIINNVNYHPSKQTALAFAIALELNLKQTQDLIGRAGYTLTHSSKFDLIIEYFILNKVYSVHKINEVLFEFDQVLLGY